MALRSKEPVESKVISDLLDAVKARWPDARFKIGDMAEGEGTGIWAYTEGDFLDVCAAVADIEFNAMIKHGVLAYVIPMPVEAWES